MDVEFFRGKKILIMGLGRFGGGSDVAVFAVKAGAQVTVTDMSPAEKLTKTLEDLKDYPQITFHLGKHETGDFTESDIIFVNPAVNPDNKYLEIARSSGKMITSQIEVFFKLCKAPIVAITGANGKSTTTSLTAHLLRAGVGQESFPYKKVWLGGNIGNKPMLSRIEEIEADHLAVLEISSFQAEQLAKSHLAPKVSIITNLTPNHLDRHGTFEAYCEAKENLFSLQQLDENDPAVSVFNAEDEITMGWYNKYKNQPGRMCFTFRAEVSESLKKLYKLPGKANLSNLAAALTAAKHFGIDPHRIKEAIPKFKALPHRLELVAEINFVRWYNDSIATTPPSVIAALEAFHEPKIIIAGGYDKHIPFDELGIKIATQAKAAILIGQTAEKIASAIKSYPRNMARVEIAESLQHAIRIAQDIAQPGDVVLMSPACASYDMFDNFEQRGELFRKYVKELGA